MDKNVTDLLPVWEETPPTDTLPPQRRKKSSSSPAPRHGGGGLLAPCWGMGEAGGGGAGPLVEAPGGGTALLVLREFCRWDSSGATSPLPVGPLLTRCRGAGGANEVEAAGFTPELRAHLLRPGDGGGFVGRGGVSDTGFSLLEEVEGGEGALARRRPAGAHGRDGGEDDCGGSSRWWLGGSAAARLEAGRPEEPSARTFRNTHVCRRSNVTSHFAGREARGRPGTALSPGAPLERRPPGGPRLPAGPPLAPHPLGSEKPQQNYRWEAFTWLQVGHQYSMGRRGAAGAVRRSASEATAGVSIRVRLSQRTETQIKRTFRGYV